MGTGNDSLNFALTPMIRHRGKTTHLIVQTTERKKKPQAMVIINAVLVDILGFTLNTLYFLVPGGRHQ